MRFHHHAPRAVLSDQLVRQRVVDERHADQIFLRRLDGFLDGERDFARLAAAEADVPRFVADDDERREAQILSALNHFGHAVDADHLIFEIKPLR
jgi:hypothetical protein